MAILATSLLAVFLLHLYRRIAIQLVWQSGRQSAGREAGSPIVTTARLTKYRNADTKTTGTTAITNAPAVASTVAALAAGRLLPNQELSILENSSASFHRL
jgi:hypothetical protein